MSSQSCRGQDHGPVAGTVKACIVLSTAGTGPQGFSLVRAHGLGTVKTSVCSVFTVTDHPMTTGLWKASSAGRINAAEGCLQQ